MTEKDQLQRFMFEHASIRGEIVHLQETYKTIINQRAYPLVVQQLLGEALLSCVLLSSSIKFEGSLNLQFQGSKALSMILVQCDNLLNVRAYASFEADLTVEEYAQAFLQGQMALNINQNKSTQTYQSMIPIESTSMAENLSNYFSRSEQIATQAWFAIAENQASGMLLQLLPDQDSQQREQFWEYAVQIGQTITPEELLTLDNQTILQRLYHETELRLFDPRPVQFKCRCNNDKMKQVLTILGEEECKQILDEKGEVEVRCDFCNSTYRFDAIDVTLLFKR